MSEQLILPAQAQPMTSGAQQADERSREGQAIR
jgi:hypothetical protein